MDVIFFRVDTWKYSGVKKINCRTLHSDIRILKEKKQPKHYFKSIYAHLETTNVELNIDFFSIFTISPREPRSRSRLMWVS